MVIKEMVTSVYVLEQNIRHNKNCLVLVCERVRERKRLSAHHVTT